MWSDVSVYLSRELTVSKEQQLREVLTIHGASISHKFRPGKDVYIVENFDSDGEYLKIHRTLRSEGHPTYILGAAAVLESAERKKPLPPLSAMPVCCRILEGTTICVSGIMDVERKKQVQMLISFMMGKFVGAMSGETTHLLVQKAGSEKHQIALQNGVKLLRVAWLADSWRKGRVLPTVDYLVRPFEGFVMAISGLQSTEKREEMRTLAMKYGGKICEDMATDNDYTHLIVDPKNLNVGYSSKYWFARNYCTDCKIVTPDWFDECVRRSGTFELDLRDPDRSARTSIFVNRCIIIAWLEEEPYLVTDEMVGYQGQEVQVTEEELKRVENSNPSEDIHAINDEIQAKKNIILRNNNPASNNERSNSEEEGNQYFDGCHIYLSGFTEAQNVHLKNMIVMGGGVRWPQMNNKITHFVVGSKINQADIETFRSINISAPILASRWLLDCYKQKRLLPADNYRIVVANPNRGTKRKSNEGAHEYEPQSKRMKMDQQQQYQQEDVDMDQELSSSPFDPNALFAKINFLVANFRETDARDVQGFIESQGGRAYLPTALRKVRERGDRSTSINYVVMPHGSTSMDSYLDIINPQRGAPKPPAVSIHWLEVSLARHKLINPSDCIVFRPFPFQLSHYKQVMEKFMVTTSNFENEERENLELLVRLVGANYSPSLKSQATTHLICKRAEGKKYERAIECDIRVVTVQWLEECVARGVHVMESKHSFFGIKSIYNTSYFEGDPSSAKSTKQNPRSAPTSDDLFKEDDLNNPIAFEEDEMSNSEYYGLPAEVDLLPLSMDRSSKERDYAKKPIKQEDPRFSDVLKDVTIYVGKKLVDIQAELIDIVSSLGGSYSWCYDGSVTHYIHDGKVENSREFNSVKKNGAHIVSSHWLRKCREENRRVAELTFPSTYNPSMALAPILTMAPAATPAKSSLRTSLVQSPVLQQNKSAPNSTSASRKRKAAPVAANVNSTAKKKRTDSHLNVTHFPSSPNSSPNEDRHENNASLLPSPSFRSQRDATGLFTRPVAATPSHHMVKKQPVKESKFFTIGEDGNHHDSRDFQAKLNAASDDLLSALSDNAHALPTVKVESSDDDNYHQNTETMTDLPNLEFLDALKQENSPAPEEDHSLNNQILEDLDQLMETVTAKPQQLKTFKPKDTSKLQVEGTTRRISRAELLDDRARESDPNLTLTLNQTINEAIIRDSSNEPKSDNMIVDQTVNASIELEQEEFDSQVIAYKSEMDTGTATQSTQRRRRVSNKVDEGSIDRFLKALDADEESQKKTAMSNLLAAKPTVRAVPPVKKSPPPKPVPQQLMPDSRANNIPTAAPKTPNRVSPVSNTDAEKRKASSPIKTSPVKDAPVFSISGFDNTDAKNNMPKIIKELGGVYLKHFDSTCTHVIAHKPIRSEKYLGACAMGIWVLKSSYLDACQKAGRFVKEEPYEWNAADAANPREKDLLEAARRWRLKLARENKRGAFDGWRVALYVVPKRQDGLKRVLESGGALVVQDTPPFTNLNSVTHIIIDKAKLGEKEVTDQFEKAKAPVYATEYISDFIMASENPLPIDTYDILNKNTRSTGTSPGNKRK